MTPFATARHTSAGTPWRRSLAALRIASTLLFTLVATVGTANAAPILLENFDDISTLSASGWARVNNSTPLGVTDWFQGNSGVFGAESGAPDSYIAANFLGAGLGGTLSEWLIAPTLTLNDGDLLTFSARTNLAAYGDQLSVRLSANGASTNTGASATSVGDFSTLLLTLAPMEDSGWAQYTVAVSGLGGPTAARLAFQYFVDDTSVNGDYIGIDSVSVNPVPEPSTLTLFGLGLAAVVRSVRKRHAQQS